MSSLNLEIEQTETCMTSATWIETEIETEINVARPLTTQWMRDSIIMAGPTIIHPCENQIQGKLL